MVWACHSLNRGGVGIGRTWSTLLSVVLALCFLSFAAAAEPVLKGQAVVLENELCRYEIGVNGLNRALLSRADQKDYLRPGSTFMVIGQGEKTVVSNKVELAGDVATVSFGSSGVQVKARLEVQPRYFTLTVTGVSGPQIDWLRLCNLRTTITRHVGPVVNAVWDEHFAVCVLACNDRTDGGSQGVLTARAYRQYGIEGAKVAILGVPTGPSDAADKLLDVIERVELDQGLPHPTVNGVWIKRAPERFNSYLMAHGITPQNADEVIKFAKGGFGCIEFDWWKSTPTYEPNPKLFPDGLPGLQRVADKIHAAGLQVGLHIMSGMVGWGPKDDPVIAPKADPRLLQDRHATLAEPVDAKAQEIRVRESTADWPETGDLYLEGELVRYAKRTDHGFAECQRGLYATTVGPHAAGARVGHLVNCFPIWGYVIYCPDVNTPMIDEICDRIARVFNATGCDMSYFDAGEELLKQPPRWRNQGKFALGVQSRLKKPVILEGNAVYTHWAWHVITRGSPTFDPIYFGRREYTLRHKGQNPARWKGDLLTGDVGWFQAHTHSLTTDAVTPDELMLLCLKAVGGKAPISFLVHAAHLWNNKRMPEILEIIRTCDELKRRNYFTEAACEELCRPMAEHVLDRAADGGWDLRPLQFGPPRVVDAREPAASQWKCINPYGEQTPWLRIRGRTALAPYGAKKNIVVADFAQGVPLKSDGSASPDLLQSVEPSTEKTPDGAGTFCYRAENKGKAVSGWCKISMQFPKTLNLTKHRRLGLWIRSEGQGGILNVQIGAKDALRDHYIPLERRGWTYVVLDPPEDRRFYDYKWPYRWTDLMYTCHFVYHNAKELNLYYNGLPAGAKTACWIGRIDALEELPLPVQSPGLEAGSQKLTFPVTLKPDEYLELDWAGQCRHFGPNGDVLGQIKPQGSLRLASGEQSLRFTCTQNATTSPRAEVTVSLRGSPLPNVRRATAAK